MNGRKPQQITYEIFKARYLYIACPFGLLDIYCWTYGQAKYLLMPNSPALIGIAYITVKEVDAQTKYNLCIREWFGI